MGHGEGAKLLDPHSDDSKNDKKKKKKDQTKEPKQRMRDGAKILFLHTETWATSVVGTSLLANLHMTYGEYGGNYWSNDQASWATVDDMIAEGGRSLIRTGSSYSLLCDV